MHENDQDEMEKLISDLYSETGQEKPSSALDEKILSEARKQLQQNSTEDDSGKNTGLLSGKWGGPMSLAAVIVLSVTVVVTIEKERPYSLTSPPDVSPPVRQLEESPGDKAMLKSLPQKSQTDRSSEAETKQKETKRKTMNERPVAGPEVLALMQQVRPEEERAERQARVDSKIADETPASRPTKPAATVEDKSSVEIPPGNEVGGIVKNEKTKPDATATPAEQASPSVALKAITANRPATVSAKRISEGAEQDTEVAGVGEMIAAEAVPAEAAIEKEKAKAPKVVPVEQPTGFGVTGNENKSDAQAPSAAFLAKQAKPASDVGETTANRELLAAEDSAPAAAKPRALTSAPIQTFASGDNRSQQKSQDNCSTLPIGVCLTARNCVLEPDARNNQYVCRAAKNNCESNFSQAVDTREICEAKTGCKYQPANCFCPPGIECICGGGPAAMCVPE